MVSVNDFNIGETFYYEVRKKGFRWVRVMKTEKGIVIVGYGCGKYNVGTFIKKINPKKIAHFIIR